MARPTDKPFAYTPAPLPVFAPNETAEQYMSKLLPYLREEFTRVRDQFEQLPIMPTVMEAPRAPFNGMTRIFTDDGWSPSGAGGGLYIYESGMWFKISHRQNGFPHDG
jgi:hypothetical protein